MHLSIDRLLTIRDSGPADVAHLEHLHGCIECSRALDSLRARRDSLRDLHDFEPPAEAWNKIVQKLDQSLNQRTNQRMNQRKFPAVAAIVFIVVLALVSISVVSFKSSQPVQSVQAQKEQVEEQATDPIKEATAELVAQSQELEQVLHQLPNRPYVQRAATASAIDDLETSIQFVDAQLSSTDVGISSTQSERLWRQRVELMTSLVNVRYAQASSVFL